VAEKKPHTYMQHYPLHLLQEIQANRAGKNDAESKAILRTIERELDARGKPLDIQLTLDA
jgi:hypothetical protein